MRYEDYDGYDYNYDDLLENTDLYEVNDEPWMDEIDEQDDEVPSYGKNYYPEISEEEDD